MPHSDHRNLVHTVCSIFWTSPQHLGWFGHWKPHKMHCTSIRQIIDRCLMTRNLTQVSVGEFCGIAAIHRSKLIVDPCNSILCCWNDTYKQVLKTGMLWSEPRYECVLHDMSWSLVPHTDTVGDCNNGTCMSIDMHVFMSPGDDIGPTIYCHCYFSLARDILFPSCLGAMFWSIPIKVTTNIAEHQAEATAHQPSKNPWDLDRAFRI